MAENIIEDIVVPRCSGKTMKVNKGQVFRVIAHEGKQVVDLTFLNANNYKEHFAAEHSAVLNSMQGTGGYYRLNELYSKPPYENVMATVISDSVGDGERGGERGGHFMMCHCSKRLLENLGKPGTRTCSDNFADAFSEIGLNQEDTYDETIFNVWMQSWIGEDGGMASAPPLAEKGDTIDFMAEMDLIAVISVCPDETSPCNDFKAKALRFQVLEEG
ncbi:MAG: urea carboxylase-associated family protein [Gammaproteobacteria bacterium]|jgi:uncharacterized protein|nr:urea carboxylase-associated family protein [Gammaproteobacteria bacterium]